MDARTDDFLVQAARANPDVAIELTVVPGRDVPTYLLGSRGKAGDAKPALVVLHGSEPGDADKRQTLAWQFPFDLARCGYLVACTDGWGCGEHPAVDLATRLRRENAWDMLCSRIVETALDSVSVRDHLAGRPDVDGSRIGVLGFSAGALAVLAAAVTGAGFAASVAVNGGGGFLSPAWKESFFYRALRGEFFDRSPLGGETRTRLDAADAVQHPERIGTAPLLFVHGRHDQLAPPRLTRALYEQLVPRFAAFPDRLGWQDFDVHAPPSHRMPDPFELLATHALHPAMTAFAIAWLDRFLEPSHVRMAGGMH